MADGRQGELAALKAARVRRGEKLEATNGSTNSRSNVYMYMYTVYALMYVYRVYTYSLPRMHLNRKAIPMAVPIAEAMYICMCILYDTYVCTYSVHMWTYCYCK